ncbi:hypothetical protein nbrc107697_02550 [Gordonia crocea]|uniref:Uncharacterized protein n=1 Tax=Gordonia crocea TaxID=589162 RepID=A0A7M3SU92_9ACTN|nr:hypothetical protein nbrc107697_02550 [Gordonia crocea]
MQTITAADAVALVDTVDMAAPPDVDATIGAAARAPVVVAVTGTRATAATTGAGTEPV